MIPQLRTALKISSSPGGVHPEDLFTIKKTHPDDHPTAGGHPPPPPPSPPGTPALTTPSIANDAHPNDSRITRNDPPHDPPHLWGSAASTTLPPQPGARPDDFPTHGHARGDNFPPLLGTHVLTIPSPVHDHPAHRVPGADPFRRAPLPARFRLGPTWHPLSKCWLMTLGLSNSKPKKP